MLEGMNIRFHRFLIVEFNKWQCQLKVRAHLNSRRLSIQSDSGFSTSSDISPISLSDLYFGIAEDPPYNSSGGFKETGEEISGQA